MITFGRAPGQAEVVIDETRCTQCGTCVEVCFGAPLYYEGKRVKVDQSRLFGCFACGACVCACPENCISVEGRDFTMDDVIELPAPRDRANFQQLEGLMLGRRSVRRFRETPVEDASIRLILEAAASAPMGLPPSEVGVVVFNGKDKVRSFRDSSMEAMRKQRWVTTKLGSALLRPFMPREASKMLREFVGPVFDVYEHKAQEGEDWFMYEAPLAMMFYVSHTADPADPIIAATYAMLAAESLGLGSIMLGFPGLLLKSSKELQRQLKIEHGVQAALYLAFGHPAVRYKRGVRRRFASVTFA